MLRFVRLLRRLLKKLKQKNEIIRKFKITLTHSRQVEDQCENKLRECKKHDALNYQGLMFCETKKLYKDRENFKLQVEIHCKIVKRVSFVSCANNLRDICRAIVK